jgi:DNA processing protein
MSPALPEEAYAVALASARDIGPATLRQLLAEGLPSTAWKRGPGADMTGGGESQVSVLWERHTALGIAVLLREHRSYPPRLREDPKAPAVLFCLGDPAALSAGPTVAIVGTRAPTRYGITVAAQLASELSALGVSVVSGLALGIDAAAHEGACGAGAPPIGVVAGGLDEPYPRQHIGLWERVLSESGAIVSESPAGIRTEKWRFPVRNRLLAALSDVVVVVESRHHGGSRHTVDAALARGTEVGAVPGSIASPTSEGPNAMLVDGAFPVTSTNDVLTALSRQGRHVTVPKTGPGGQRGRAAKPKSALDRKVYAALTTDPASVDQLLRITGLDLPALYGGLERLALSGLARDAGGWWERL